MLSHPWLVSGSCRSEAALPTPALMRQNNNVKQLSQFADSAAAVNRVVLQHLSGRFINKVVLKYKTGRYPVPGNLDLN